MNKRNTILYAGLGLWASGMLVGANAVDFLPGEPSWPPRGATSDWAAYESRMLGDALQQSSVTAHGRLQPSR
jgi:hypothetical protein